MNDSDTTYKHKKIICCMYLKGILTSSQLAVKQSISISEMPKVHYQLHFITVQ